MRRILFISLLIVVSAQSSVYTQKLVSSLSSEERIIKLERELVESNQRLTTLSSEMREMVVHTREALTQFTMRLQELEKGKRTPSEDEDILKEIISINKRILVGIQKILDKIAVK